jgi:oligoribonuclease NrnB/cAMP/cGMP phosphodiesterase (DHH superfamily)
MRIITRPDFDGIVCAVILFEALDIKEPVLWADPNDIQKGLVDIRKGDILANLPYHEKCSLWFDHHYSNQIEVPFEGAFEIAPSAAVIVYKYYKNRLQHDYSELVRQADKIDSADLSLDEVNYPEKYPYVLLSMTILNQIRSDRNYWNRLIELLRNQDIKTVLDDQEVKQRCQAVVEQNKTYKQLLLAHTELKGHVSVTDFRSFEKVPPGNRFLSYALFPETVVNVRIRNDDEDNEKILVSVGHSIFNRNCNVNVGLMLSQFEGGGHRGAGGGRFHIDKAQEYIPKLVDILIKNEENEPGKTT